MSEKLLPCPFCGGDARTFEYDGANQATCGGKHIDCAGTDVVAPVAMWNRRTPAPEGEACPHDAYETDAAGQPVRCVDCGMAIASAAAPVVPVGVSVDALAQEIRRVDGRHTLGAGALAEALLPFLAALRPTDTGWREITAEARNGDDVLAYDDETGDCHGSHWTGDYWYGPNGFKPTHWMPLPPAPTDTGANHD